MTTHPVGSTRVVGISRAGMSISKTERFATGPRVLAVTEFGGYSYIVPGHVWSETKKFGYRHFKTPEALMKGYQDLLLEQVSPLIPLGLGAAIYTQTTDIETEINGLLTYDRKVEKWTRHFCAICT